MAMAAQSQSRTPDLTTLFAQQGLARETSLEYNPAFTESQQFQFQFHVQCQIPISEATCLFPQHEHVPNIPTHHVLKVQLFITNIRLSMRCCQTLPLACCHSLLDYFSADPQPMERPWHVKLSVWQWGRLQPHPQAPQSCDHLNLENVGDAQVTILLEDFHVPPWQQLYVALNVQYVSVQLCDLD